MDTVFEISKFVGVTEKYGRKGTVVCDYSVEITPGIRLSGSIWANLSTKDGNTVFSVEPNVTKDLSFDDDNGRDEFKASILEAAEAWEFYETLEAKAQHRLTSPVKAPQLVGRKVKTIA